MRGADPAAIPGKADTTGGISEAVPQPLRRGSGDSMYTKEIARNAATPQLDQRCQPDTRERQAGAVR